MPSPLAVRAAGSDRFCVGLGLLALPFDSPHAVSWARVALVSRRRASERSVARSVVCDHWDVRVSRGRALQRCLTARTLPTHRRGRVPNRTPSVRGIRPSLVLDQRLGHLSRGGPSLRRVTIALVPSAVTPGGVDPTRGSVVENQHAMPSAVLAVLVVAGIVFFLALILYANQAG
jgi:hypothetical protein